MIPKKYRAERTDIENTIKKGNSIFGEFLYAKSLKGDLNKGGFAVVISKKNEKTSVGRHKIKRKINSYIEENIPKIKQLDKTIVFFIKKNQPKIDYNIVKKDVDFIINKTIYI